ncbi:MAG TPA: cyclic nucleotide-binding domain-containing protein [Myxococcaceae bacterium]|nr:cyclic nucleotide-binding domain-containing protein [Myxococcaceae bacterium]
MEMRKLRDKATEAFSKGRFSKAAEFYEEYCRGEPKDFHARLRMGDAWAKAGQRDRAISSYQFAAEGFAREGFLPRAIAASKLILELDPAHRGVQQMLADLYARKSSGDTAPQRARLAPRKLELPTFTEHMGVSMGPAAAPLELPEEDEPAPPPQRSQAIVPPPPPPTPRAELSRELPPELELPAQEPEVVAGTPLPEQADEEELPVVSGIAVTPAPVSPSPPRAAPVQAPPVSQPVPPPSPAASPAPPGLAPRGASQRPASGGYPMVTEPPRPAPASAAAPVAAPVSTASAPPGLKPRRPSDSGSFDMAMTPRPGQSAVPGAGSMAFTPRPGQSAVPGKAPVAPIPSSFTELELETDTLLHAVEEAALAGMKQRATGSGASTASAASQVEEILELTDEEALAAEEEAPADALPNIPLFSDLPRDAFIELFERCPLRRFSQGQRVFEQGSHGDAFYVICEGSVRVFRQDGGRRKDIANLSSGAFFGEMALLSGAARMAAVESSSEDTQLLEISATVLSELSRQHPQVARALKKFCRERLLSNVMGTSALFQPFSKKDRRTLVEKFRAREVKKNETIIHEGDRADGLYVVLSGEVEARKGDQVLSRLKEGELFGEISLLQKTPATATVAATRRTSLLRLPREDFDALILSHPQILVLISELSEQRLRRTEALTGGPVMELSPEELLV